MGLDRNSKISEIVKNPKGAEILEKYIPGFTEPGNLEFKMKYSLNQLHFFQGGKTSWLKMDKLMKIDEELRALD
ncbi:MAG: hypothetical protein LBP28_08015 [Coriobacteriales bacterium]|jgi:hypothetical protein|nr:hypothetical protein [Coriobacteriales bacterium]